MNNFENIGTSHLHIHAQVYSGAWHNAKSEKREQAHLARKEHLGSKKSSSTLRSSCIFLEFGFRTYFFGL